MTKTSKKNAISAFEKNKFKRGKLVSMTFRELFILIASGQLVIPSYQRNFVTKDATASGIISSIVTNMGFGTIVINKVFDEKKGKFMYRVIDGLQRISTAVMFVFAFCTAYVADIDEVLCNMGLGLTADQRIEFKNAITNFIKENHIKMPKRPYVFKYIPTRDDPTGEAWIDLMGKKFCDFPAEFQRVFFDAEISVDMKNELSYNEEVELFIHMNNNRTNMTAHECEKSMMAPENWALVDDMVTALVEDTTFSEENRFKNHHVVMQAFALYLHNTREYEIKPKWKDTVAAIIDDDDLDFQKEFTTFRKKFIDFKNCGLVDLAKINVRKMGIVERINAEPDVCNKVWENCKRLSVCPMLGLFNMYLSNPQDMGDKNIVVPAYNLFVQNFLCRYDATSYIINTKQGTGSTNRFFDNARELERHLNKEIAKVRASVQQ